MNSYWSLNDSKYPQVSKMLKIISDFNNGVDVLDVFLDFQWCQSCFQVFLFCTKDTNYNCNHCHFHDPHLYISLVKSKNLLFFFFFFFFSPRDQWQNSLDYKFFTSFLGLIFGLGFGDPLISQREFYASRFLGQILVSPYTICYHGQN